MSTFFIRKLIASKNGSALSISVLFFVLIAPFALSYLFHHPDEKHYTNAVIAMLGNGDYLTPTYPDGSLRFLKPIFTYWTLLAGYFTFGVSEFSSRIPSLLGASVFLFFFFKQLKLIFNSERTAILSTLILASNPLYIMCSSRNIPDIWLCIFLSLMGIASIRLLKGKGKTSHSIALFYLGASLATATKGLPALAYSSVSLAFLLFNPWNRIAIKHFISPYWIPIAAFIASFWYVAMYLQHGQLAVDAFLNDQVNERVGSSSLSYLKGFGLSIVFLLAYPLAWLFQTNDLFTIKIRQKAKSEELFILLWISLTILFCTAVSPMYDRYILPVVPLLSVLIALKINPEKVRALTIGTLVFRILFIIAAIAALFSIWLFQAEYYIILILAVILFINVYTYIYQSKEFQIFVQTSSLFGLMFVMLSPYIFPHQANQIISYFEKKGQHNLSIYDNKKVAAKLRVNGNSHFHVNELFSDNTTESYIIKDKDYFRQSVQGHITDTISYNWRGFPIEKMIEYRLNGKLKDLKKESSEKYFLIQNSIKK